MNINNVATFGTLNLPNFAASGVIGAAAATVDEYSEIQINQTTPGVVLTLPLPTMLMKEEF